MGVYIKGMKMPKSCSDVLFNEWKCIDRNDGIHCDRKCESCDLVMDVEIIRKAFNMAISALQAQDVPDTNVGKIDRYGYIGIETLLNFCDNSKYHAVTPNDFMRMKRVRMPEPCEDAVSRNAIIQKLNTMDRYVSEELILCDTDKKFPKNEVFIVDDVYEEIVENLPSARPEIVRCKDCKYWREHKYAKETKRYIPFCGFNAIYTKADDFCSRAERRTDG